MDPYTPKLLPDAFGKLEYEAFMNELIDASAALEVFVEKIKDSKVDRNIILPTLQKKEALSSSAMEGTQATLDEVFINQVTPSDVKDLNEVVNYQSAFSIGYKHLRRGDFDEELFLDIHRELLTGNVRKTTGVIGEFRNTQNCIRKKSGEIVYTPPKPELVQKLMDNLIEFMNRDNDQYRHLIRIAIIHAQFETIHPFGDGNGRVGRIIVPLYLFAKEQLPEPFFFISEALERDIYKYYKLLMDTRVPGKWNEWIKYFLEITCNQCRKYIGVFDRINELYEKTIDKACEIFKSSSVVPVVDALFKYPVIDSKTMQKETGISLATINRYLNTLSENGIVFSDGKQRNRHFFFYDLMAIIRE